MVTCKASCCYSIDPSLMRLEFSNKAVAEGAISFHIDHFVSTRVAKFTYGAMILAPFVPTRADHQQRAFKKFTHIDGEVCLSDIFDPILRKVCLIIIGYLRSPTIKMHNTNL